MGRYQNPAMTSQFKEAGKEDASRPGTVNGPASGDSFEGTFLPLDDQATLLLPYSQRIKTTLVVSHCANLSGLGDLRDPWPFNLCSNSKFISLQIWKIWKCLEVIPTRWPNQVYVETRLCRLGKNAWATMYFLPISGDNRRIIQQKSAQPLFLFLNENVGGKTYMNILAFGPPKTSACIST